MRSLFVMDPLESLNVAGDSTYMLMRESSARGWSCAWCTPADLYARGADVYACVETVRTLAEPPRFVRGERNDARLGDFDVVWMRKDPPFDMEYIFATYLLELAPTVVLNRPSSLRSLNEKIFALQFPEFAPATLLSRDIRRIVEFAGTLPDRVVLKPWDGNGGRGVLVTRAGDPNLRSMIELLTAGGRTAIFAQQYIPEITTGDKRIILIDGRPAGAMLRVPGAGDHRGNMHVGARVERTALSAADRRICDAIGPRLAAEGLLFVGIDVIGDRLTEINVTSPTGIQEINRLDGTRLEVDILDAAMAAVQRHRGTSA